MTTPHTYGGHDLDAIEAAARRHSPGSWESNAARIIFQEIANPATVLALTQRVRGLEAALESIADYAAIEDADEAIALLEEAVTIAKNALEGRDE